MNWRTVDRALRSIAQRRAALDAEEARWLRKAERLRIWKPLGMVSAIDYMERVLGYAPHAAKERLRVARALGELQQLNEALAAGELSFSAVRELSRVVTPATEQAWIDAARGANLRQVEELVAGHRLGDLPSDPADPEVRARVVRFELQPGTFASMRQARQVLEEEHGHALDDDAFMAALAAMVLDGRASEESAVAKFQIALTVCAKCKQGWQDGAGAQIAVGSAMVARAECDAQHVGSLDAVEPERAYQDVPPATRRLVWRRDHGRCRIPGCRSARALELHHIVHREHGGTHEPGNLILACASCHTAHHDGRLSISGTADHLEVRRSHVGPLDESATRAQAKDALVQLGWKPSIAVAAIEAAREDLGDPPLERLIFEALRRCPRPAS